MSWKYIDTYPVCESCGKEDCDWGPETLLLIPRHKDFPYRCTVYVGHKEAGMWLVRTAESCSWEELPVAPVMWHEIEPIPNNEFTREPMDFSNV